MPSFHRIDISAFIVFLSVKFFYFDFFSIWYFWLTCLYISIGSNSPQHVTPESCEDRLTSLEAQNEIIKRALLDEAARIISSSTGPSITTTDFRAGDTLRLPSVAERGLRPPTVQGMRCGHAAVSLCECSTLWKLSVNINNHIICTLNNISLPATRHSRPPNYALMINVESMKCCHGFDLLVRLHAHLCPS